VIKTVYKAGKNTHFEMKNGGGFDIIIA